MTAPQKGDIMQLTVELTPEQMGLLALKVAETLAKRQPMVARPLTVSEFARATGLSEPSVYRLIAAKELRVVAGLAKKLIPASELERFK
jgi:excisionase family DNA binding protein